MLRRLMIADSRLPEVAYRYWRARVIAPVSGAYIAAQEIEFRGSIGGPDLTSPGLAGARALESGHYDVTSGARAFDNNLTNYTYNAWVSQTTNNPPVFVGWDFEYPTVVREIAWLPQNYSQGPYRAPSSLAIDGSTDKLTWNQVASFGGITGWAMGAWKTFSW